ncbi:MULTISPECIES: STAS domain-containing protein [unclassified Pseudonocardia]|uniref:STAS domain-containing protein n=1 Tax=unclassified Pseudonocardia TaxID=2619320 RepID=UPI0009EC1754|nr:MULTISPECIES: STAS domain-containing protein [unclassified Pseudonocardia]
MNAPRELSLTWTTPQPGVARVHVAGDLDYDSADALTSGVDDRVRIGDLRELRVDCSDLAYCDSYGLSSLLMVRRRTASAGVPMHLDNRGPGLERLLRVTKTLDHLTGGTAGVREEQFDS